MREIGIGILHAHNTLNYGSMMMCENTIFYLSKMLPNANFIVLSDFVEETEDRLKSAAGCNNISVRRRTLSTPIVKRISNKMSFIVDQVMLRYRNLNRVLDGCNVVIVLGGDDIAEFYGIVRLADILLRLRYIKKAGKKVYLLGQTIGPIHSWRLPLAKWVLPKMDRIYHRGPISYNYVTNVLGIKGNSFLSADLAFLDLARQDAGFDIERYNIQPQKYITFVPSGFWSSYCRDYKTFFNGLLRVKNYLLKICEQQHLKLVLLPHVLRTSDDRTLVRQMIAAGDENRNIVTMTDPLLPFEAREILGKSYLVVTQRMHGAISSLQKGVPAICLSYSVKFSEVVGNYLGLPELVVEIRKANFRKDLDKACSTIDLILQNIATLKVRIEKKVSEAKKDAWIQIEDIAKDILS
jgi:colanic acid/amylovoran biosynthesis protein